MLSIVSLMLSLAPQGVSSAPVPQVSGIVPRLTMRNDEGECGVGAVVAFADRLWVITYAPHAPRGSSDKLYEVTPDLRQIIRPESIGGTPASRMLHVESGQLFIGPYVIDAERNVRVIPYTALFGRLTGIARHLTEPAGQVVMATMEEGVYAVDVESLAVTELWRDEQLDGSARKAGLPGYHGKGFYSGQGVYVYANNGEHGREALRRPDVPSGVLAEWDGAADSWTVVRRAQFTEVTGPGGIRGNRDPRHDPIWTVGWDERSLLLGVRDPEHGWTFRRLPKASHTYDGAHGWNTEWPRIRDIGEDTLLMTMHGTLWSLPPTFSRGNSVGIRPRASHLKVIGDFCRFGEHVVFGCDDTANKEFLNVRRAKGTLPAPRSQSNLWFVRPADLERLGPPLGRGAVWYRDDLAEGAVSDPFLFAGYTHRGLSLAHDTAERAVVLLEVDRGDGTWQALREVEVPAAGDTFVSFDAAEPGEWIRLRAKTPMRGATAMFGYRAEDRRTDSADIAFRSLAESDAVTSVGGLVRARGDAERLSFAAIAADGGALGHYELDPTLMLRATEDAAAYELTQKGAAVPAGALALDAASVIYRDEAGRRWRLPKGPALLDAAVTGEAPWGPARALREVATERDLLHAHGTFYELPAENAGGVTKVRPIASHTRRVHDFCSYCGLLVMSGIDLASTTVDPHVVRSTDGRVALWVGALDDLWRLGKPRGVGGPWARTLVAADEASDPYLMSGYDHKRLQVTADGPARIVVQVDLTGDGLWRDHVALDLTETREVDYTFPRAFSAYWARLVCDRTATLTAQFVYE